MLATPARTKRNYRAYSAQHLARLRFIRRARALGFSIEPVQELPKLADQKDISCSAVDAIAREHLAEIYRILRDLNNLRAELKNGRASCVERVCKYSYISVVSVSLNKNTAERIITRSASNSRQNKRTA